jgi:hypothetical protein
LQKLTIFREAADNKVTGMNYTELGNLIPLGKLLYSIYVYLSCRILKNLLVFTKEHFNICISLSMVRLGRDKGQTNSWLSCFLHGMYEIG